MYKKELPLKTVNGLFQSELLFQESSAVWGGACEKETARRRNRGRQRRKETGTWKTSLFLSSSQLGLWKSERGPTWSRILLKERAVSLLFLTPVSPWLSNQSLAEPMSAPLVYILMNQGNYSSRFWSVSLWCFFSTVTEHSVFVICPLRSCLDNFRLSAGCWIKV